MLYHLIIFQSKESSVLCFNLFEFMYLAFKLTSIRKTRKYSPTVIYPYMPQLMKAFGLTECFELFLNYQHRTTKQPTGYVL